MHHIKGETTLFKLNINLLIKKSSKSILWIMILY